jgi:peptidoglycan lytic transglycosylase
MGMVERGYWRVGVFTTLTLVGGCGGIRQPQHAAPLNVVSTPSLQSLSLPNMSLPTLSYLPFSSRGEKIKAKAEERESPTILPQDEEKTVQTGMASWYGPGFHGKRTANGEVYNQHALTAAHRTLPLGTRAVVTNVNTGESVEVRINDRGPYKYGRVIDLSYAAARRIGMWTAGVVPVRVEVLHPDEILPPEKMVVPLAYAVLLASSTDAEEISSLLSEVGKYQSDAYVTLLSSGPLQYYQLRLGPFRSRGQAAARARELTKVGVQALIVAEDEHHVER